MISNNNKIVILKLRAYDLAHLQDSSPQKIYFFWHFNLYPLLQQSALLMKSNPSKRTKNFFIFIY